MVDNDIRRQDEFLTVVEQYLIDSRLLKHFLPHRSDGFQRGPLVGRVCRAGSWLLGITSIALAWALAMVRLPYPDRSVVGVLKTVEAEGIQLLALTTLSQVSARYAASPAASIAPLVGIGLVGLGARFGGSADPAGPRIWLAGAGP